jgi:hypothetical protein
MSLRFTLTDRRSGTTGARRRVRKAAAAVFAGALLAGGSAAALPAAAHADYPHAMCVDGWTLVDAYYAGGYYDTGETLYWNLMLNGC